jgi:hypothetical protein
MQAKKWQKKTAKECSKCTVLNELDAESCAVCEYKFETEDKSVEEIHEKPPAEIEPIP